VSVNLASSGDCEAQANRLRADLSSTVANLRSNLTPHNLASEAAARAGFADASWTGALDYAGKRHPLPTAIIGLGLGLWTLASLRRRAKSGSVMGFSSPLTETSSSLVDSATTALRRRAEEKRQEFLGTAQAQVVSGAEKLSDEIERQIEKVIGGAPGGSRARPLIASVVQIGLAAALDSLLHKRQR